MMNGERPRDLETKEKTRRRDEVRTGQEAQSADVKSLQQPSSRLPCWNDAGWGLRGSIALERKRRRTDGVLHHTSISAGQISTVQIAEELGSALSGGRDRGRGPGCRRGGRSLPGVKVHAGDLHS